jgi:serine protease Do
MKRTILTHRTSFLGALTLSVLAAGVIGAYAFGDAAANRRAQPVVLTAKTAPSITPAEARRAVSSAKDLSTAFRVASAAVLPSVVTIENVASSAPSDGGNMVPGPRFEGRNPFEGTPFEEYFNERNSSQRPPTPQRQQPRRSGMGSGVIIDEAGVILTNNHVVAGDGEVTVRLHDGREFRATTVATDPKTDIAIVKIDATDLVAAKLGDSDTISIGDWVLALGQPFGLESTVTAGIISAKHRGIGITARENFLQTDAAINPGNSGGPLVNLDGELVGINTAISSRGGGNDGVGFAVPINLAKWVGKQLAQGGTVQRAYLGVGIQPIDATLAAQLNVKPRQGVAVTDVYADTPAAKAGLKSGDVIVQYAGISVTSPQELQLVVERSEIGRPHPLQVLRDGKVTRLEFVPAVLPTEFGQARRSPKDAPKSESRRLEGLGIEVSALDPDVAEQLGLAGTEGVVITAVKSGSPAERAGLTSGMVVTQVNRRAVSSIDELTEVVKSGDLERGILLLVRTNSGSRFVIIKP